MSEPTDEELTAVYNEANGINMSEAGNWMPSTCLAAMRLAMEKARKEQKEADAAIVDQCNHEGPYQAIGAAERIRNQP